MIQSIQGNNQLINKYNRNTFYLPVVLYNADWEEQVPRSGKVRNWSMFSCFPCLKSRLGVHVQICYINMSCSNEICASHVSMTKIVNFVPNSLFVNHHLPPNLPPFGVPSVYYSLMYVHVYLLKYWSILKPKTSEIRGL